MSLTSPGAYRTVLEALNAPLPPGAPRGRHILIEPGSYPNTGFRSKGDFVMTAVEGLGSVTLDGRTVGTIEVTGKVTLQGLIVRNWSDKGLALEVAEGTILAEQCEFMTRSRIAVRASKGAQLTLRDCEVQEGAVVYSASSGVMESTSVTGTDGNAVAIRSGSTVTLRECRISDAGGHGIWATEGSKPLIDQCTVSGPALSGIRVDDRAEAELRDCEFRGSGRTSLVAVEKGKAVAEDCLIVDAGADALWVATGGSLTARRVKVESPQRTGMVVEKGTVRLDDCEVVNAPSNGIYLARDANLMMVRGRVADTGRVGVELDAGSRVLMEGTTITGNKLAGVSVEPGGELAIRGCTLADNIGRGILTCLGTSVQIENLTSVRNGKPDRFDFDLAAATGQRAKGAPAKPGGDAPAGAGSEAPAEPEAAPPVSQEQVGGSADVLLARLEAMVGLAGVKREIRKLTNLQKVAERRR
ncbi:right-handed parallel beta-helix repeat-containing protein, partial [Actinomadura citrea]|uniref:right-handed parallel beta-helix repeat-containing protein n=1 Tax=Actinomadura citrea TaxID=46158 RepID=UPI003CE4C18F